MARLTTAATWMSLCVSIPPMTTTEAEGAAVLILSRGASAAREASERAGPTPQAPIGTRTHNA